MGDYASIIYLKTVLEKWSKEVIDFIPNIFILFIVLIVAKFGTMFICKLFRCFFKKRFPKYIQFQNMFMYIILTVFWMFIVLLILDVLKLTGFVTHILAGAGIIGVIGGFALKDVVSNAFAGFLIRMQRPFVYGDWVNISGYEGTVEYQGIIMTGLKTIQGEMAYIPNQTILNSSYLNYSKFGTVMVIVQIGISYGDYLKKVEEVALKTVRALPMTIRQDEADFYFINIGGSTYNFQVRFWINYGGRNDYLRATNEAIQALKLAFEKEGIMVAYNVLTLDFGGKGGVNLYEKPITFIEKNDGANKGSVK